MRTLPLLALAAGAVLAAAFAPTFAADGLLTSACDLAIHEERMELENARLAVDLAHTRFEAFNQVFGMIDRLFQEDAIQRMRYLEARHDRDAAQHELDRAALILVRQEALLDQFHAICDDDGSGDGGEAKRAKTLREAHDRYLDADCDQQHKAIDVATADLAFAREWRDSMQELRQSEFASKTQMILATMDVELEEKRLADARQRAETCRKALDKKSD